MTNIGFLRGGVFLLFVFCLTSGVLTNLHANRGKLENIELWIEAREEYFADARKPTRPYRVDGVRGKIVDPRLYSCPNPEWLLVTFGESYENTTGWDLHVALIRKGGKPVYPGNVHLSPVGADMALDWIDETTLGIFYRAGYYPDLRRGEAVRPNPYFEYEKAVEGCSVRFIGVEAREFDERRWNMEARRMVPQEWMNPQAFTHEVPERWQFQFDGRQWIVAAQHVRPDNHAERIYVPYGQTSEIWREMVTSSRMEGTLEQHLRYFDLLREYSERECSGFKASIGDPVDEGIFIEWSHDGCQGMAPQYSMHRLMQTSAGVLALSYTAKTREAGKENLAPWREILRMATVVDGKEWRNDR